MAVASLGHPQAGEAASEVDVRLSRLSLWKENPDVSCEVSEGSREVNARGKIVNELVFLGRAPYQIIMRP